MKGERSTTLAPGVEWKMPKEMKEGVPLKWKLAAQELGKRYYRVDVVHWSGLLSYTLQVAVYRDKDTLNPNYYDVVIRDRVMYHKESKPGGTLWPIYPEQDKQVPPEAPRPRGAIRRQRHPAAEVHEDGLSIHTHSIFCERAEVKDDVKTYELQFERNPTVQTAMALNVLRKKLTQIELRICAAAIAETAAKDLAS